MNTRKLVSLLINYAFGAGLAIRLFLAWFLPLCLDDGRWIPGVAYTDVDYHVFTDAAQYVNNGGSPYDRHTYRYTPFLAELLSRLPFPQAGRYLFCLADALCGWLIIRNRTTNQASRETRLADCLWWMYNPLAINICTRGSAESLMVLLPVLLTVRLILMHDHHKRLTPRAMLAGLLHGIAIHSKLYPVIYTLSYMAYLAKTTPGATSDNKNNNDDVTSPVSAHKRSASSILSFVFVWTRRLFQPAPLLFATTSVLTFLLLTYVAVLLYGPRALDEGLLYHLSRVDHRHNYSIFWYPIYLARAQIETSIVAPTTADNFTISMTTLGRLLLLPQFLLLCVSSLGLAPYNLGLALFSQTYLFVTLNKVITAQYFTWYLCLLPLCSEHFVMSRTVSYSLMVLGLSIGMWLASAYLLEMQGWAVHRLVWMASLLYFGANVNLLRVLLGSISVHSPSGGSEAKQRGKQE